MNETIIDLIRDQASKQPQAVALLAPDRPPLAYRTLVNQLDTTAAQLADQGIRRGDRVALVLPNGPESAVAFLGLASLATCAPLNPAYSLQEFEFYLSDLKAKFLVIEAGSTSPASAVAAFLGIQVIELQLKPDAPAGIFFLSGTGSGRAPVEYVGANELAVVLHTSGTTSRPKIVPLTHANLAASARNTAAALKLRPSDRCLNIMPLFHVHGLLGAVVASLTSGASVICTPGLNPDRVLEWMKEFAPTWYTAVPTMHQAILESAERHPELAGQIGFRFVRSCSSALSPQLGRQLEDIFHTPLIEAYGMTEASHQIASNPLPPLVHKLGSVGLAVGNEVAILDEQGMILPMDTSGEISIRGPNVMREYENNPAGNASAFVNGWLRTGDRGYLDAEGYLFIQARLKEIINRGGEKISPREIDDVLQEHPAVLQAVAFAIPHPTLGEDIAAVVVLRPGKTETPGELRQYVAERLAEFKVPRRIIFVPGIPKGPTGKIQRLGLAEQLKAELDKEQGETSDALAPRNPVEELLVEIWQEVLGVSKVGVTDEFLALGGDSIRAIRVLARINERTGQNLTLRDLFTTPTIADLAKRISLDKS
jgi:acyl-CoA synthetase (AMP-forming)/AMP-acid ligase II/aryl carrier-like protein